MSLIFNDKYYAEQEDDIKPKFPDIDKELNIESTWDNYDPTIKEIVQEEIPYHEGFHCEDAEFNVSIICF
jgi:hypothetical protein